MLTSGRGRRAGWEFRAYIAKGHQRPFARIPPRLRISH